MSEDKRNQDVGNRSGIRLNKLNTEKILKERVTDGKQNPSKDDVKPEETPR